MSVLSRLTQWWNGRTGRGAFVLSGVGLMLAKYNVDRLIAFAFGRTDWNWTNYWRPANGPLQLVSTSEARVFDALLAAALPFIAVGVLLTVRRLRDCDWPMWLVVLFFIPAVNVVFFAVLAAMPPRLETHQVPELPAPWWLPRSKLGSALAAIGLTSLLGAAGIFAATKVFQTYGAGIFVALPFTLGLSASVIYSLNAPRTLRECLGLTTLAVGVCALLVFGVALEGGLCIVMAAPLALVVALFGALVGHSIARIRLPTVQSAPWAAVFCLVVLEAYETSEPPLIAATTTVVVNASPELVWPHVVEFSELPRPTEWVFRTGIAYPVRAHIDGTGVGAIRRCEFSTGPFIEPITVWNEPHHLAFGVTQQPHPMRELSPYRSLEPAHLEGFFRSRRGEFVLTRLPDGRTELAGTTWYDQRIWPNRYWQVWSDYLVHRIHTRVLNHIKTEVEASSKS